MQRTKERKMQYGFHHTDQQKPHPEIKIGGRYLEDAGFSIGDKVTVVVTENAIIIHKANEQTSS